jgi:hypothetical protein
LLDDSREVGKSEVVKDALGKGMDDWARTMPCYGDKSESIELDERGIVRRFVLLISNFQEKTMLPDNDARFWFSLSYAPD